MFNTHKWNDVWFRHEHFVDATFVWRHRQLTAEAMNAVRKYQMFRSITIEMSEFHIPTKNIIIRFGSLLVFFWNDFDWIWTFEVTINRNIYMERYCLVYKIPKNCVLTRSNRFMIEIFVKFFYQYCIPNNIVPYFYPVRNFGWLFLIFHPKSGQRWIKTGFRVN